MQQRSGTGTGCYRDNMQVVPQAYGMTRTLTLLNEESASSLAYTRSVTIRGSFKASQTVTECGSTRRSIGPERISGRAEKRSANDIHDITGISPDTIAMLARYLLCTLLSTSTIWVLFSRKDAASSVGAALPLVNRAPTELSVRWIVVLSTLKNFMIDLAI